jgi:hypothetical protein
VGKKSKAKGAGEEKPADPYGGLPILRTSERKSFKDCPQQWQWAWRYGLKAKYRDADALWFGTGVHEALAQWYKKGDRRGLRPDVYFAQWCSDEMRQIRTAVSGDYNEDVYVDAKELGEAMLLGYYELYGPDETWDVIATEMPFQVKIADDDGVPVGVYAGTLDGVYRDRISRDIWLMEHKTAKQIVTRHLHLDDQAGAYWAIASAVLREMGILRRGESIGGVMYNFLRKGLPDARERNEDGLCLNKDGSVSKTQPSPLFVREPVEKSPGQRQTQIRKILDEFTWINLARDGSLPIIKSPKRDCAFFCQFFTMCELHDRGGEAWADYFESMYSQQDPYADHRKSASE